MRLFETKALDLEFYIVVNIINQMADRSESEFIEIQFVPENSFNSFSVNKNLLKVYRPKRLVSTLHCNRNYNLVKIPSL